MTILVYQIGTALSVHSYYGEHAFVRLVFKLKLKPFARRVGLEKVNYSVMRDSAGKGTDAFHRALAIADLPVSLSR